MRRYFISYGDKMFNRALKRIGTEAKKLNLFDEIILYTDKDLPPYITGNPAFAFNRGGGYWLWKAYVIRKTLMRCNEGDVVVYADAGCTLNQSDQWQEYFQHMEQYNGIFFQYRDINYGLEDRFRNNSLKIKHWMKQSAINYFSSYFCNDNWLDYRQIWGGAMFVKKAKSNTIIEEWFKIKLLRPDLLVDAFGTEIQLNTDEFNEHRHDQSLLTPLVHLFTQDDNVLVLQESSESVTDGAITATRSMAGSKTIYNQIRLFLWALKKKLRRS